MHKHIRVPPDGRSEVSVQRKVESEVPGLSRIGVFNDIVSCLLHKEDGLVFDYPLDFRIKLVVFHDSIDDVNHFLISHIHFVSGQRHHFCEVLDLLVSRQRVLPQQGLSSQFLVCELGCFHIRQKHKLLNQKHGRNTLAWQKALWLVLSVEFELHFDVFDSYSPSLDSPCPHPLSEFVHNFNSLDDLLPVSQWSVLLLNLLRLFNLLIYYKLSTFIGKSAAALHYRFCKIVLKSRPLLVHHDEY